ncbi:ATP-binding cassette domain-containing protein [Sphingobacterium sp. Mn56C]|uniref:ABC transporter ATP-binding protein n=1 Tax=Sphingobacterium sp. Mn56C TaxID=3395261 RepID=UPI003BF4C071
MITIQNLNFSYHKKRPLFKDMSLQLKAGHIYGLLGKNGAGKSTLLKNMAGLVFPQQGAVTVLGFNPAKREVSLLQDINFIPEEFHLPTVKPNRFVKANAGFYPNFDHAYFQTLMTEFQIPTEQNLSEMSYGQKKKFIISFGLATRARFILMDEPTNGLDIPSKAQFRKIMASALSADSCIIISTHQVRDLEHLIDAVIILDEKQVALIAPIYEIEDALLFQKTISPSADAIYTEQVMGGFTGMYANSHKIDSKVDLELLFNGVLAKKSAIQKLLKTTANGQ